MGSARVFGVIVWIMINDLAGGIAGLAIGWLAMAAVEPVVGDLAGCILLVSVPAGLSAGGLAGVVSLGWLAAIGCGELRPRLSHG